MKIIKRISLFLAIIPIMMGVCGCMNEDKDFQTPVLEYLKDKYEYDFSILSQVKMKGNDGEYVQLVCECGENPGDIFRVECYLSDGTKSGDCVMVGAEEYVVYEKYSDIVFARQMEQELRQKIPGYAFIRCDILSNHSMTRYFGTTKEQFRAGMKVCLGQADVNSYVNVYIAVGADVDLERIRYEVESYALGCNARAQYLFLAVMPELDEDVINRHYEENKDSFVAHMGVCEWILQLERVELKRDQGIINRFMEKG